MAEVLFDIKVTQGPSRGKKFAVKTEAMVFGSDKSADIVLEAPGVEPRHAQIVFQGGQVMLEDLGTQTGTFRNGKRLLGPVQVFPGDRVGLGPHVVLTLEGDDPREGMKERGLAGAVNQAMDTIVDDLNLSAGKDAVEPPAGDAS